MKALAITTPGMEDVCGREISELIKVKGRISPSVVVFEPKKMLDLCILCYKAQSVKKVLFLFDEFVVSEDLDLTLKGIKDIIKKTDISEWLSSDLTFKAECQRLGNHNFSSIDIDKETGGFVLERVKAKVNLDNPELIFYIYIHDDRGYIGIDFSGFDLSKRDYKIFSHPTALNGALAYSLARLSGFDKKKTLLDPFCGSGTIPIEAVLYASDFPVHYFSKDRFAFHNFKQFKDADTEKYLEKLDKKINKEKTKVYGYDHLLRNIKACQKNAKIAGILKQINLSKVSVEWLDTKFKEKSIDHLVCDPPEISKRTRESDIIKVYKEFFYQAAFVLKEKGSITLIIRHKEQLIKAAEYQGFRVSEERDVLTGKEKRLVLVFSK